eukprot:Sro175_g077140.1 Vacuolar amino acid transporter (487) ;mRNA; r:76043-77503
MVGPAILYLPHGFVAAGYLVALPIMAISTAMYLHSSRCLLEAFKFESQKELVPQQDLANDNDMEHNPHSNPHSATASGARNTAPEAALAASSIPTATNLSYPDLAYRAFGTKGETLVKVGIALMQSGVCLTYAIFVPHNLHSSLLTMFNLDLPPNFYLFLMVCLQIRLSFIQDIRKFTTTNAIANACILYGLIICLYFAFGQATAPYEPDESNNDNEHNNNNNNNNRFSSGYGSINSAILPVLTDAPIAGPLTNLWEHFIHLSPLGDHWILFIGTSVLLFEGSITLLLPLQQAVDDTHKEEFPTVYRRVILSIQVFYVIFAVSCWMSFGDSVNTVLTTSLPPGFLATTVQLAYSVAVLFTFPLQNYPALEIASKSMQQYLQPHNSAPCLSPPTKEVLRQRHIIAAILVCILAIVAVTTMDSLDKVVSLTGALIGIPIAFMIPPMIHSQLMATQVSPQRLQINLAVTLLGSVAMVVASVTTILQWND